VGNRPVAVRLWFSGLRPTNNYRAFYLRGSMNGLVKEWRTDPNCCWFTDEVLRCHICKKKSLRLIELLPPDSDSPVRACWDCLHLTLLRLWAQHEYVNVRSLETEPRFINKKREPVGLSLRYFVLKRDKFRCVKCGNTAGESTLEIDHIVPVASGGRTDKDNLQTLCFNCNRGKRDG
jgi:5-methylcytosine-specific restriction enzyme A